MAELEEAKHKIKTLETQLKTESEAKAAALKQVEALTKEKADALKQVEVLTKEKTEALAQLDVAGKVVLDLKNQLAEKTGGYGRITNGYAG